MLQKIFLALAMVAVAVSLAADGVAQSGAARKLAFVVGIAQYDKLGPNRQLPLAKGDSEAIAAALRDLGYEVVQGLDLTVAEFDDLWAKFREQVQAGALVTIYLSGHGVQFKTDNYLLARDVPPVQLDRLDKFRRQAINLQELLLDLQDRRPRLSVMIVDACRDDPLLENQKSLSLTGGMGASVPPKGNFTMYAAAPGQKALERLPAPDGHPNPQSFADPDPNSVYTRVLLRHLRSQGVLVQELARRVRSEVIELARSRGYEQRPTYYDDIEGEFCLAGCNVQVAAAAEASRRTRQTEDAKAAWDALGETRTVAELESYLSRFGGTSYGDVAKAELERKKQATAAVQVAAAQTAGNATRIARSVSVPQPGDIAAAEAARAGRRFSDCPGCPEMIVIPAGTFTMGSAAAEQGRGNNEGPQHQVTIARPFAVGRFEVTFAQWDACVAEGGCKEKAADQGWGRGQRPVVNVSWIDAHEYLAWIARKTDKAYRLLTEAEWEYVARAGTSTPYWTGQTITAEQANFAESERSAKGGGRTEPAGTYAANPFGLHDTAGNAAEWVADCYVATYTGAPTDGTAVRLADNCASRGVRGGSWRSSPSAVRSTDRIGYRPEFRSQTIGFRIARVL